MDSYGNIGHELYKYISSRYRIYTNDNINWQLTIMDLLTKSQTEHSDRFSENVYSDGANFCNQNKSALILDILDKMKELSNNSIESTSPSNLLPYYEFLTISNLNPDTIHCTDLLGFFNKFEEFLSFFIVNTDAIYLNSCYSIKRLNDFGNIFFKTMITFFVVSISEFIVTNQTPLKIIPFIRMAQRLKNSLSLV